MNGPAAATALAGARAVAVRLIRQCEGCVLHPYQDSAGIWTIGVGSIRIDGQPVTADTPPITQAQADELLDRELAEKAAAVDAAVRVVLNDQQRAALYSFAYNEGVHAFQTSTLLRLLNAGDLAGAADELPKWVYAGGRVIKGLENRRRLERSLLLRLATV